MVIDPSTLVDLFNGDTLGSPGNAIGFILWRVTHRYVRELDRALAGLGLTHLQFTVLALAAWMSRSGKSATQVELARFGDIHSMQVSLLLKTLEAKGMVERSRDVSDPRSKRIGITAQGVEALRLAMPIGIEVQRRLFGEAGRPGGWLLKALAAIEGDLQRFTDAGSAEG